MNLDLFKPYLGKSFELEKDGSSFFCTNAEVYKGSKGNTKVYLYGDYFTLMGIVEEDWSVSGENPLVCKSPCGETYKILPVYPPDFEAPPKVEWKDELGLKNLLNENLWEKDLIRDIFGITYYPLNLFQFTDRKEVLRNPDIQLVSGILEIDKCSFPKTLYYYIADDFVYIGVWNYIQRIPLDPVKIFKIKNIKI